MFEGTVSWTDGVAIGVGVVVVGLWLISPMFEPAGSSTRLLPLALFFVWLVVTMLTKGLLQSKFG